MDHIEAVVDYILETEFENFFENPSSSHVYFHALACRFGLDRAREILKESQDEIGA